MIEVVITGDMLVTARDKAAEMGRLRNSIISGAGNLAGFIGEAVAQQVMGGVLTNTYNYDLILCNGKTVDVKTKQNSVKPLETYECSVAALNTTQECDYYALFRVNNDFSVGWFLGVYEKQQYMLDAKYLTKGTIDTDNGYVVKSDCYNLPIHQLKEHTYATR